MTSPADQQAPRQCLFLGMTKKTRHFLQRLTHRIDSAAQNMDSKFTAGFPPANR
jgi:hypothetical protein